MSNDLEGNMKSNSIEITELMQAALPTVDLPFVPSEHRMSLEILDIYIGYSIYTWLEIACEKEGIEINCDTEFTYFGARLRQIGDVNRAGEIVLRLKESPA